MSHETFSPARTTKNYIHPARTLIIVFSLDSLQSPQIWNIEQNKDREKEKVGGSPAKLNEKKGDRDLERERKNKGEIFLLEEQYQNFVAAVTK